MTYHRFVSQIGLGQLGLLGTPDHIPTEYIKVGGDEENRTPDPLLARQVLSQLSYTPITN